jgi:hypothetical protein
VGVRGDRRLAEIRVAGDRKELDMSEQGAALRGQLRMQAESGATLNELARELVEYKGPLSADEYEELWLYCWALTRREAMLSLWGGSGGWGAVDDDVMS